MMQVKEMRGSLAQAELSFERPLQMLARGWSATVLHGTHIRTPTSFTPTSFLCHGIRFRSFTSEQPLTAIPASDLEVVQNPQSQLAGTAITHSSYILLHTRVSPMNYPSKIPSRLQRALQLHATQYGGVVNFCWSTEQALHPGTKEVEWESPQETYSLTGFSRFNGKLEIPEVSLRNLEEVQLQLERHSRPPSSKLAPGVSSQQARKRENTIHLYVCTHQNRDCRCGETGGAVYAALQAEVSRRQLLNRVKVGAVGHVGGHKFAANLLVYPSGDWLGNIRPANVPEVLDAILDHHGRYLSLGYEDLPPLLPDVWRGRMGLSKDQQLALLSRFGAGVAPQT